MADNGIKTPDLASATDFDELLANTTVGGIKRTRRVSKADAQAAIVTEAAVLAALGDSIDTLLTGEPYVMLAMGQSNIDNSYAYSWTPPPNLFYWNATSVSPGTTVAPISSTTMRVSYSFAAEFARNNPSRPVYVINIGRGSTPIANWLVGGSPDMYAATKAGVEAFLTAQGLTKIDHLLWWQGESDYFAGSVTYVKDWQTMWFRLFAETWFPRITPVTIMAVSERYVPDTQMKTFNRQLRRIVDIEPQYRTFVDTSLLPATDWDDPAVLLHFNASGHFAGGKMAYDAAFSGLNRGRNATPWQTALKRTTQTKTSTVATLIDPELQLALRSGYTYRVRGVVAGQAAASSDFKWGLTGPAATAINGVVKYIKKDASTTETIQMFSGSSYPSGQQVLVGSTSFFIVEFDCLISSVSADGIFGFMWGQNSSVAELTYVFAGSYLEMMETS